MLKAWVISQAKLVDPGGGGDPGWQGDFTDWQPEFGVGELVRAGVKIGRGRNPLTGGRRVLAGDIYEETIVTDGVISQSDLSGYSHPIVPSVVITQLRLNLPVLLDIHTTGGYLTLAAEDWQTGESLDYAGQLWGKNDPISAGRWTPLRNGLVLLGVDAQTIDNWRTANPEGVPLDFFRTLNNYIKQNNP